MMLSRRATLASFAGLVVPARAAPPVTGPIRPLAHSDQGGRPDGVQAMVSRSTLYVGHMFSNGITVMDVADPANPKPVRFIPAGPNTRTHHLQTHGDLMLVACGADIPTLAKFSDIASYYQQSFSGSLAGKIEFAAGVRVYDISRPADPCEIGFLDLPGIGVNRLWYVGGRYAYISAQMEGFTDHILVVADMSDPARPTIAGRWWLPGMWLAGGERPSWTGKRVALHHAIVAGPLAYAAWRDGGLTILDVSDVANIKLISHVNTAPPFPGATHTTLPLPGRKLVAVLEESTTFDCQKGLSRTWLYDVRSPENPVSIATLPTPSDQSWCRPAENFGPHNLWENRPEGFQSETLLFATYHNAGLRIFDISDPFAPKPVGSYVPLAPTRILDPRPGYALAPMTCDVNVQKDGIIYMTDWNGGLSVLTLMD